MKASAFHAIGILVVAIPVRCGQAIDYPLPGSLVSEDFNGLPVDPPSNANIENLYLNGWQDDATTAPGDHVGIPGWYLHHPLSPASENGTDGHQRLRFGTGINTGSFWAFSAAMGDPDKALGSIGSTTVAANGEEMTIGWRLTNTTGLTLTSFTLTFDGEQWRDGAWSEGETMTCSYSLAATAADWFSVAFTPIPQLAFTAPVVDGSLGAQIDGNSVGAVRDRTATVSDIVWPAGTDLWIRWGDPQLAGIFDDGLAIDNVRFHAEAFVEVPVPAISFVFAGSSASIAWNGSPEYFSLVEYSSDLLAWTPMGGPVQEADGATSATIPAGVIGTGQRFFRVVRSRL